MTSHLERPGPSAQSPPGEPSHSLLDSSTPLAAELRLLRLPGGGLEDSPTAWPQRGNSSNVCWVSLVAILRLCCERAQCHRAEAEERGNSPARRWSPPLTRLPPTAPRASPVPPRCSSCSASPARLRLPTASNESTSLDQKRALVFRSTA
jgi:hypothetical protein